MNRRDPQYLLCGPKNIELLEYEFNLMLTNHKYEALHCITTFLTALDLLNGDISDCA